MPNIESRLAAVERQLHFHRFVIAGLLVALVALVGHGATEGVPDEIVAKSLKLVNDKGEIRVYAGTSGQGNGVLSVVDLDNGVGVQLLGRETLGYGGVIYVKNKAGQEIVVISANEYGMGQVGAYDRQGKGRTLQPR